MILRTPPRLIRGRDHGERYAQVLRCETTYNNAMGAVRVERRLYRHASGTHAVCPWD